MNNKVVIITGATSGIGKALVYEFAKQGASLVIGARSQEKLITIAEDLKLKESEIVFCRTDVSIEADCKQLIDTAVQHYGRIDVLINNAGISMRALFAEVDLKVIKQLMDVNFWGTVYCSKYALPYLLETKGSLVGVSSIAGVKGLPGRTGYSASKFALQGFLECIRIENLKKGLHVLIAYPGFTATNIRNTSLTADGSGQGESPRDEGKMMTSETVALHIRKAVKKRKNSIVLTTQGKLTVVLNKFFPKWLDKMVFREMAREHNSPVK